MTELAPPPMNHIDQVSPDTSDSESLDPHKPCVRPAYKDVGKRVLYYSSADKKYKYGYLRFFGETEFASGTWCGVELSNASGKNNGTFKGIRYFTCDSNHGVFVPLDKVEMDFGRRSRPNSTPNSRSGSVEREVPVKSEGNTPTHKGLNTLSLQQQLVNRLSTPVHRRGKTSSQTPSSSRRQPLKAFATKGVGREQPKEAKRLPPFKSGGMMKARSTENISKDSANSTPKMPSKKSSSEKDLRGFGGKNTPAKKEGKISRKTRVNSCSDLLAPEPAPSKPWAPTPAVILPRTSTPGTRDELAPDGCSSPDDDSGSNTSQSDDTVGTTPNAVDRGFIETPDMPGVVEPSCTPNTPSNGDRALVDTSTDESFGLETAAKVLKKSERHHPSYNAATVALPESATSNRCYKNRPSGTATLAHPLTQHAATHQTEESDENSFLSVLLDSKQSLEGVSVTDVVTLLREQHRLNVEQSQAHKTQLEALRKEYSAKLEKMERQHRTALKELVERHQSEIMALNRAHVDEMKRHR